MLSEVDRNKFWCRIPCKTTNKKHGDVHQYFDKNNGEVVGYVNVFSRRYFVVIRNEEEKDIALVAGATLTPVQIKAAAKKTKARIKTPDEIFEKYPHAIKGTLTHDDAVGKNKVRIKCIECGDESRWVYTSDLFQTKICLVCKARKGVKKCETPSPS